MCNRVAKKKKKNRAAVGKIFPDSCFIQKRNAEKPYKIKAFEACRKISEKFLKLVLTIIGEGDIVYIVAGDTNETKQHRSKDSSRKNTAR